MSRSRGRALRTLRLLGALSLACLTSVAPMSPARADHIPISTGTGTWSITFDEGTTFTGDFKDLAGGDDAERFWISQSPSAPGLVTRLRAEFTSTVDAVVTLAAYSTADVAVTDLSDFTPTTCTAVIRTADSDPAVCPFDPWTSAAAARSFTLDVEIEAVPTLAIGTHDIVIELREGDPTGPLIGQMVFRLGVVPNVAIALEDPGPPPATLVSGLAGSSESVMLARGADVLVAAAAFSPDATDDVTLRVLPPDATAYSTGAAALADCAALFGGGACPFGGIVGALGVTTWKEIGPIERSIAPTAALGEWVLVLGFDFAGFAVSTTLRITVTEPPPPATPPPSAGVTGGMAPGADGATPSLAPGEVEFRLLGEVPRRLTATRTARPAGLSASEAGLTLQVTGDRGLTAAGGPVAGPAGTYTVVLTGAVPDGAVVEAWMASTPRLVAAARADGSGRTVVLVPVGAPLDADGAFTAGPHTLQLQVPVAGGIAVFDVGVVVGGPVPGSVPAGAGPGVPSGLPLAGLLAVVAVAVLGVARARGRVDVIGTGGGARVPSARLASG